MASSQAARAKIDEKSFENRRKGIPNPRKINEKSILRRFGRPRPFRGRVRTRSGRLLDAQVPPQGRSGDAPGRPRAARSAPRWPQDVPGTPRTRLRSVPERSPSPIVTPNAIRDLLRSIFDQFSLVARKLRSAFRIAPASVLSMLDVWRGERAWLGKTSKKQPFRLRKSKSGASRGTSDEQVRAPKRPVRAKKRARSASGASKNL